MKKEEPETEIKDDYIYTPYIRHWRTGKIIYPRNSRFFRFKKK